ncbi:MAG: zf-HC2 domain-containing protein [Lachnospiraceae bacterium]
MKINCEIVKDLLPLYVDGVCTQESRKAVEEHLESCKTCQEMHDRMTKDLGMDPEHVSRDLFDEETDGSKKKNGAAWGIGSHKNQDKNQAEIFRKGMRKIRRRWFLSVIAAFLVIPLLLCTVNQVRGEGICFTNQDDILRGFRFLYAIKNEQYDKAFDMLDSEDVWKSLTVLAEEEGESRLVNPGYEQWREKSKEQFIGQMEEFREQYGSVEKISFHAIYRSGTPSDEDYIPGRWQVEYDLSFGQEKICGGVTLFIGSGKVSNGGGYDYIRYGETNPALEAQTGSSRIILPAIYC